MKRLLNILMIIVIYLSFCGKSCENDEARTTWQTKQAELAKDTIQREFGSDYLTEEARHAAEVNAIQKLNDFADYVEIFSDQSLDSAFREKAGEMISKMFISKDNRLTFGPFGNEKMKQVTLKEFLERGFGEDYLKAEVNFDSIRVMEPLIKTGDQLYTGKLAAIQTVTLHPARENMVSSTQMITIDFMSSRQQSVVGQDTLKVWKVLLGNFEGI